MVRSPKWYWSEKEISVFRKMRGYDRWFRYFMPYRFIPLKHDKHRYVMLPLNREHKPMGMPPNITVNYNDYIGQAIAFRSDPAEFKLIWVAEPFGLYHDDPVSLVTYFERLGQLLAKPQTIIDIPDRI
ncbi:MAG: hypothetical protein KIS96_06260 [Bauldia sp.]|nr:hypothetical protein [Bauldia sp.]